MLPSTDIDLSLEELSRIACTLLDVPVYGSIVQVGRAIELDTHAFKFVNRYWYTCQ